jgi:hypothetical protein
MIINKDVKTKSLTQLLTAGLKLNCIHNNNKTIIEITEIIPDIIEYNLLFLLVNKTINVINIKLIKI